MRPLLTPTRLKQLLAHSINIPFYKVHTLHSPQGIANSSVTNGFTETLNSFWLSLKCFVRDGCTDTFQNDVHRIPRVSIAFKTLHSTVNSIHSSINSLHCKVRQTTVNWVENDEVET